LKLSGFAAQTDGKKRGTSGQNNSQAPDSLQQKRSNSTQQQKQETQASTINSAANGNLFGSAQKQQAKPDGVSPQKLGKLRGLSPSQQEREKSFNKIQQSKTSGAVVPTDSDIARLMTSPMRPKVGQASSAQQHSSVGSSGGHILKGVMAPGSEVAAVSSWNSKQLLPASQALPGLVS